MARLDEFSGASIYLAELQVQKELNRFSVQTPLHPRQVEAPEYLVGICLKVLGYQYGCARAPPSVALYLKIRSAPFGFWPLSMAFPLF